MVKYKITLTNILSARKRAILNFVTNNKHKEKIRESFSDISSFVRYNYVPVARIITRNEHNKKLKMEIKKLRKEVHNYKQTLKILKIGNK